MTADAASPPLQEAAWQAKKEEEAKRKAEEEAAAIAASEAGDERKAQEAVNEIKREYQNWRAGGGTSEAGRWRMVPAVGAGVAGPGPRRGRNAPCGVGRCRPFVILGREAGLRGAQRACRLVSGASKRSASRVRSPLWAAHPALPSCRWTPQNAQPGQMVLIQYNRLGGPFKFEIPPDQKITLKIGERDASGLLRAPSRFSKGGRSEGAGLRWPHFPFNL